MRAAATVPGHRAPGVGFESPFELLAACHDRVRRSLDLLERLQRHVKKTGCDDEARSAAQDVLRYFDLAAPLHHQDEELHVFPVLLAGPDAALHALVRKLQAEHVQMDLHWQAARAVLLAITGSTDDAIKDAHAICSPPGRLLLHPHQVQILNDFAALYGQHMDDEEQTVYPASRAILSEAAQGAMGHEMGARRRVSP